MQVYTLHQFYLTIFITKAVILIQELESLEVDLWSTKLWRNNMTASFTANPHSAHAITNEKTNRIDSFELNKLKHTYANIILFSAYQYETCHIIKQENLYLFLTVLSMLQISLFSAGSKPTQRKA